VSDLLGDRFTCSFPRIRIWDLSRILLGEEGKPLVLVAKGVSCLDYFAQEEVFVVGTHDVGRVQVWRKSPAGDWVATYTLPGHLHGVRAVA
jgi:pyrimidine and pyridine-specific 5'-nucleotidase